MTDRLDAESTANDTVPAPSREEIALRAYEIYTARNGAPGDAEQDWLQAEAEIRDAASRNAAAGASGGASRRGGGRRWQRGVSPEFARGVLDVERQA